MLRGIVRYFVKMAKPRVVFVLGGPGAGKGTQCANIVKEFGFVHLSAGELLRQEQQKPGSPYGETIATYIRNGTIVPVEITCKLIERAMEEDTTSDKFLIDGFPRNKDNLDGWNKEMKDKVELLFVLFLEVPDEVCIQRCLGRGAAGSGRDDDNLESLKGRLATYHNDSLPIVQHYEAQGLVRRVSATKPPEEVFEEIKKIFSKI